MTSLLSHRTTLYRPYSKQAEFHAAGATYRERCLLAANQIGKTLCAGEELSYHCTGHYPDWWVGKRFHGPTNWWFANTSNEATRDNPQRILMGEDRDWGTGTIPKQALIGEPVMARGFSGMIDKVHVRHKSGGVSSLQSKTYEQGRKAWQGATLRGGIWCDEEMPMEIYGEAMARLAPGSILLFTVTPMEGMSEVVCQYYPEPDNSDRHLTQMQIEDATMTGPGVRGHYTIREMEQRIQGYPEHERDARAKGLPMLGEGRIYSVEEGAISEPALPGIPDHWPRINGLDFGYRNFAAVSGAWDREADCLHITHCYTAKQADAPTHASAIKSWGGWIRNAWPHDGHQHEKSTGEELQLQYKAEGLKMLPMHAQFLSGGYYVEPGIASILLRMKTGRLRVAEHLSDWWAEFRSYHRKDGKIVKERDHVMDAMRVLEMSLRFARTQEVRQQLQTASMDYDPIGGR